MRVVKVMGALFFSYHALSVALLNFPPGNALSETVIRPFRLYAEKTAQWQNWDMFDTIPIDEKLEMAAFVVYPDRTEKRIGPIVPGLAEFRGDLKLGTFFYYFDPESETDDPAWRTYSTRLCREVSRHETADFTVYVDFIYHRLRTLEEIRRDGVVSEKITLTRKASCD